MKPTLLSCCISTTRPSQIIKGRNNSEIIPKTAAATTRSGGGFAGAINAMTGEFSASIPPWSVSTPFGWILNVAKSLRFI